MRTTCAHWYLSILWLISILYIVSIIFILDSRLGETDSPGDFSLKPRSHYMFSEHLKAILVLMSLQNSALSIDRQINR